MDNKQCKKRKNVETINLRDYQSRTLSMLYKWLENNHGNVCVVLPTGSGKSVVLAELCKRALTEWPDTRIVMLTRSVELIRQNAEKLKAIWPNAPMGIYSSSAGRKELGEPITIGGPLSVMRVTKSIGHCDLLLVDEAHDIGHKDEGSYRKIVNDLKEINPSMRVIGWTASPFRLGHGMITDKPAIFDDLIEPVSIEELIHKGYLTMLRSKHTDLQFDISKVHKRGGDFIESELESVMNTSDNNKAMIDEVIKRAENRKSWMFFATGVSHAENLKNILLAKGISAASVTGKTPKKERDKAIADFKSGKITAMTQVGCLNVGFDHPDIDLLVMARPTMSPGLYLQQAGRGLRPKSHTDHCLVLDFAGVVEQHGPITAVEPPNKEKKGDGKAPTKTCESCGEIVAISTLACPSCGAVFEQKEKPPLELRNVDIMGLDAMEMTVVDWHWQKHISRTSGNHMLSVRYYSDRMDVQPITEYFPVLHDGYAGQKARAMIVFIAQQADAALDDDLIMQAGKLNKAIPPATIKYRREGKYHRVVDRTWTQSNALDANNINHLLSFINKNKDVIGNHGASNAKPIS